MESVASSESRSRDVVRPDGVGRRHDFLGTPGSIDARPQASLVELPYAGATVKPHFHDIDQFQVVVAGSGRIGKKALAPVTFQYADAYTPYGPIVAADAGLSFFTLRNVASGGHFAMPGSRHLMACRAGRNISGALALDADPLPPGTSAREILLPAQPDGVTAVGIRLGARARAEGLAPTGGGQYYLVCAGALAGEGRMLPRDSLLRLEPGEPAPVLEAGADGALVLALQFARPSQRPGSDPGKLAARDPRAYVARAEPGR